MVIEFAYIWKIIHNFANHYIVGQFLLGTGNIENNLMMLKSPAGGGLVNRVDGSGTPG